MMKKLGFFTGSAWDVLMKLDEYIIRMRIMINPDIIMYPLNLEIFPAVSTGFLSRV
ncbi:MAG: hypothetical protein K2O16_14775 [Lachnospiraceae bacterium]|nr:hypothetical protein [Lachnospiraceae bacterium]